MHALDALGNPIRRDILLTLRESPLTVGEIAAKFPVSRPAISRHIKILGDCGLVELRAEGTRHVYTVRSSGFASVREFLDMFWDTALARLELLSRK